MKSKGYQCFRETQELAEIIMPRGKIYSGPLFPNPYSNALVSQVAQGAGETTGISSWFLYLEHDD